MFWYWLLGVLAGLVAISLALPITRRIWAFHFYAGKYVSFWLMDVIRLRWLWFKLRGRRYSRLTRPVMIRLFCEDMGPTFIKFGQIVASSAGMFPDRYVKEFQKCLDRVRPFSFEEVEEIIREELGAEKAAQLTNVQPKPLASASIAQVHTAELADGTKLVVKVQRPGIQSRIAADMKIMRFMAVVVTKLKRDAELANPVGVVEDFAATLREELDFRLEAKNLDRFNEIMGELGHRRIRAPVPHWELTTGRVLVMERFFGNRVDEVSAIQARGIDAEDALVLGLRAWFQCVVFYGFFHGDVHAGNLMLLQNDDLGFLDFGIVGRFDDRQRYLVTDYIIAFSTGDFKKLAEVIMEMGGVEPDKVDMDGFVADLQETYSPMLKLSFAELNYADFLPGIQRVASRHRMYMPKEFILITKQMLYFDRYAKLLAPNLNIFRDPRLIIGMMGDIQKARMAAAAKPSPAAAQA
jgi:predicted unusual protein kinase regulating ubiquinone biosynthesis (AarF/ABC1/UbiB family)